MKNLQTLVDAQWRKWFPTEEDKVWTQWVNYKRRETRDLVDLLTLDVRTSFKRRAMFLLLVPSPDLNPIYWKEVVGKFYHDPDFVKGLTSELTQYAGELIIEFSPSLKSMHCPLPKHIVEGNRSIQIHMNVPDKYHAALSFYNRCIPMLLPVVSAEQGERLFSLFSLNDISVFSGMEESSGYNPFRWLLSTSELDERWKRAADTTMRTIVLNELAGQADPRAEWESAPICYADAVQEQIYSGPNYSTEFFAEQIQFILENRKPGIRLIEGIRVAKLFRLLADECYRDLRHQIARYVMLEVREEYSSFSIYDGESRSTADRVLEEFGQTDQELASRVHDLVRAAEQREAENQASRAQAEGAEQAILSAMK